MIPTYIDLLAESKPWVQVLIGFMACAVMGYLVAVKPKGARQ